MINHKINILGIYYSKIKSNELMERLENENNKTISFAPVDSVILSRKNSYLKEVYNSFDYVLADGMPIIFASKLLGNPLPERISGPDFFKKFIDVCSKKNYSIFFLGSDEKTIKIVKKKVTKKNTIQGYFCPPIKENFNLQDNKIMINKINKAKPDFLFIVLGAPKQDIWIQQNKNKINVKAIISIGAAFDFYAEKIKRPPEWMQKIGLEWLFRLMQEPRRLYKRYLRDFLFPFLIIKSILIKKIYKRAIFVLIQ